MMLRPALMLGCALGALSLAGRAGAQAFNANPSTLAGTVSYDRATPGVETVTVETDSAIILWVPNVGGNPINFLPFGRTATFINGASNSNFAVLNRIQTDVPIQFNGTVLSRLQDPALGTSVPGGTVIFQSPNGIIVGQTALFDVGNLVLTSLTVTDDGTGNFIDPAGTIHFVGGDKFPKAGVIVLPGGQILANSEGSYVGLIAPNVQQGGLVRVNGSTAYVAAEGVDFRVNGGLFDLIVTAGTQIPTPLIHTGTTGGPASTGAGDVHRIYMVAVPKNTAITALLQGNVGFDSASVAGVENGAIVLSAGYSVANGEADRFGDFSPPPVPDLAASFEIRGGIMRSDLFGSAVTNMLASGQATGSLDFQQDVSLFGGNLAELSADSNQKVTVGGNALVSAARFRTINLNPIDLAGGNALISAGGGGSIDIFGNATVDASAQGVVNVLTSTAGHGTGGFAGITAVAGNSSVRVRGNTQLLATGAGGMLDFSPDRGGNGQGGTAAVRTSGAGNPQIQLDGTLTMDASGTGSRSNGSANPGASGTGGDADIRASRGTITVAGATALTANGTGGEVTGGPISGGTGQGGTVELSAIGTLNLAGDTVLNANGFGAIGPTGGTARGGTISLTSPTPPIGSPNGLGLNAGTITGTAAATGVATTGNVAGEWHVNAGTNGDINIANLSLTAAANGTPGPAPFSSLETTGTIRVSQLAQLTTPGEIRVIGTGPGTILGGRYNLAAGQDVVLSRNSLTTFMIDVGDLFITAGDDFRIFNGVVTRTANQTDIRAADDARIEGDVFGRNILIVSNSLFVTNNSVVGSAATDSTELRTANSSLITGRVFGRSILITAAAVNVGGGAAIGDAATQQTDIRATGNATIGGTVLGGAIDVQGAAINVSVGGRIGDANTAQTRLTATGNTAIAGRVLGRDIRIASADVDVTGAVGDAATQQTDILATGTASAAGNVLGQAINVQGAAITVTGTGTIGGANTAQARLTAAGNAAIAGRVLGRDIRIASVDIDLTGAVGDAATQLVTLAVAPATQAATLGGGAQGPGYTLTGAEAGRIRADTLRVNVPALGGNPALFVRDLTFTGGGAAAGIGLLDIVTPGIARVEGNLLMTGARAADGIAVTATQRLEVATPTGSIRVRDGAGMPGGTLALTSNNIWAASAAIIDRLRLDPNYAGRDSDLLDNNGADVPRGYIEANGVLLNTGGTLFVQNTGFGLGTFATGLDFAGITAGPGGLVVRATGVNPATATAFGRRLNADGSFTTGYDFFFTVAFQEPARFTAGSTFNTCIIPTGQCPARPPANAIPGRDPTTGPTGGGSDVVQLARGTAGDDLVDTSFAAEPLIEEPVTSGGESILWEGECDRDRDPERRCNEDRR